MAKSKSPVEKRLEDLRDQWMRATEEADTKLLIWRPPGNAERMLDVFFEAQKHPGDWSVPDMFLNLEANFETSFSFSRELKESLLLGYSASRAGFLEEGAVRWDGAAESHPDTAAGLMGLLNSFAEHHREFFRYLVLVVAPARVASANALEKWVGSALQVPISARIKLCLVDDAERKRWQPLVDRFGDAVRVIESDIDMFDIARNTAAQAGGAGPATAYRPMLVDVMTTLEKGSAAQVASRADKAMRLATRHEWPDQQGLLHMAVAGAYLKEQQFAEAIVRYRAARECATRAREQQHPVGANLVMQTWFGEAGAWLAAQQMGKAADAYRVASREAIAVPNAMFVIEGLRMAAFCCVRSRHIDQAREDLLNAVSEGKKVSPADRPMTTFPMVLQDLLRLQDSDRATGLEKLAAEYQSRLDDAHQGAEIKAARLGPDPARQQLAQIDTEMLQQCEAAFSRLCKEREELIATGDEFFKKVVAVARDLLHPQWNGLPEVKHPLDKELPEWTSPPDFAVAPDAMALTEDTATVSNELQGTAA